MSIKTYRKGTYFCLTGTKMQYIFSVDQYGLLRHLYWGKPLCNPEEINMDDVDNVPYNERPVELIPEEYSPFGGLRFKESAIKVEFDNGTRDIKYYFKSYKITDDELVVILEDSFYRLQIELHYKVYEDYDILERYAVINNIGESYIKLENVYSALFNFPLGQKYRLSNVYGYWAGEQRIVTQKLESGKVILDSKKGTTGHNHNPYFVIDSGANEDEGEVYFGVLEYSGNFSVVAENTPYGRTRVLIGINPCDFSYVLKNGQSFITPKVYAGISKGYGEMSRCLHRFSRDNILSNYKKDELRSVLYNSWEATRFNVDEKGQMELAKKASELGVELFVMDDGWFGKRNSDKAGLGDWFVNKDKFPNGLQSLIKKVKGFGMKFGVWIEPEMVNPDSELYRNHPDWILRYENRENSLFRNQLVLDLTNKDVEEYVFTCIDELLSKNEIDFIKWDMNRPLSEAGALTLGKEERKEIWFLFSQSFIKIVERIREKHPRVFFEACSAGGGRIDYSTLRHFDQFWVSDNTDAFDRLFIQEGFSMVYPAKTMSSWVTDCPNFLNKRNIPLKFRFNVSMMGNLGIGGDLNTWSSSDEDLAKIKIAEYKSMRHIIQDGEVYRLKSMREGNLFSIQYSLGNENVVFVFLKSEMYGEKYSNIKLKGLEDKSVYKVCIDNQDKQMHGDTLMSIGIKILMQGDYDSKIIRLNKIE
jgi:alpha-galactosidase